MEVISLIKLIKMENGKFSLSRKALLLDKTQKKDDKEKKD